MRAAGANLRIEINRYLLQELGIGETKGESGQEGRVSQSWPFRLQEVRGISAGGQPRLRIFRFRYAGDPYFVEAGKSLSFWSGAGMSTKDLRLYLLGAAWLTGRTSVELDSEQPGDPGSPGKQAIPTTTERRRIIKEMGAAALGAADRGRNVEIQVLEGLFFPSSGRYLALVELLNGDGETAGSGTGRGFVIGSGVASRVVEHAGMAPWRWLLSVIGGMLERGELQGW